MKVTVLATLVCLVHASGCADDTAPGTTTDTAETISGDTTGDAGGTPDVSALDATGPDAEPDGTPPDAEPELPSCPSDCGLLATCSADTNYACEPLVGACLDSEGVGESGYCDWQANLDGLESCRLAFNGDDPGFVSCVQTAGGFATEACSSCFAGLSRCAASSCGFECVASFSLTECVGCLDQNCQEEWACAGIYECPCTKTCPQDGRPCGDDGCGGSCGECDQGANDTCNADTQQCQCQPDCTGKQCGDDGCGGNCNDCLFGVCDDATGQCVCTPDCNGKVCGDDGCGNTCSPGCADGSTCSDDQTQCVCEPDCEGKVCGPDGCGGTCGSCQSPNQACLEGSCAIGGTCDLPIVIDPVLPTVYEGSTSVSVGAENNVYYESSWCQLGLDFQTQNPPKGSDSRDAIHAFTAPTNHDYRITLEPVDPNDATDTFAGILYLAGDCADIENTCIWTADESVFDKGTTKTIDFQGDANVTYYIIVDGRDNMSDVGPYTLTVDYLATSSPSP